MPSLRRNHSSIKYNQNNVSEEKLRIAAWSRLGRSGYELLDFWRLHGLVTNIESVYYIHFGDLDSADSVAEIFLCCHWTN